MIILGEDSEIPDNEVEVLFEVLKHHRNLIDLVFDRQNHIEPDELPHSDQLSDVQSGHVQVLSLNVSQLSRLLCAFLIRVLHVFSSGLRASIIIAGVI